MAHNVLLFVNQVEGALRTEFQGRKDEIRNRNLEELTTVKNAMEEMMDGLWQQLQSHISQYRDATADKRRTYNELLAKDKKGGKKGGKGKGYTGGG